MLSILYLLYYGFEEASDVGNLRNGFIACFYLFCLVGMLTLKNGPFTRPHAAAWRVVLSISIFYELCLVFMLFQNKNTVRAFLNKVDPTVGIPLVEKSYALDNCNDLSLANLWDQIDWFVLAHALGWFCKALVLRDYWFCWLDPTSFQLK